MSPNHIQEFLKDPEKHIPFGVYCYDNVEIESGERPAVKIHICPFWTQNRNMPSQMNGYCALLKKGDWMKDGTFLLWDQVKECGINEDYGDEE
jgi:hypothetical protein